MLLNKIPLFLFCSTLTDKNLAAERSSTICLLAVPSTMTCHDLMTFTAACYEDIQCLRIIKDSSPNQYMALIKFRSSVSSDLTQHLKNSFYSVDYFQASIITT